ncbi:MAG: SGNH/GDSL hydrolase family protein [Candidatus Hydrogenedens sp.]
MKYHFVKSIGKILIFFLWIIVAIAVAECVVRIYEYLVIQKNPLISSLNDKPPWSHSEVVSQKPLQSVEKFHSPDMSQWYANRAKFFLQLDETDRQLFSSFYQITTLVKDMDKKEIITYLPEPTTKNYFDEELINILEKEIPIQSQEVYSKYYHSFAKGEESISDLFVYYKMDTKNRGVMVCWYKAGNNNYPRNIKDRNGIWEIPYFEYKKHAQLNSYEFHTNNFGFRDEDVVVPKPLGVFRIVCIGGSTTEEGPTEQETYPNIMEKLLLEQFQQQYKIEVINAGIPGISAHKLWLRLPDYLLMEPNLVLYCEGANDITHILLPYWLNHLNGIKKILIHSNLCRNIFPLFFLPNDIQIQSDINKDILSQIEKINNYLQQKGILFAVMSMPAPNYSSMTWQEKDYFQFVTKRWWGGNFVNYRMYSHVLDVYNRLLSKKFNNENVLYIPMYEMFQNESPSYFNDLCHQKLQGIRKKSELATPYLVKYIKAQSGKS